MKFQELFRAENQVLFWLLIAFILLLCLLFAIFLCCIFCPCCYLYSYCKRYDKRRGQSQELNSERRRNRKTYPSRIEEEPEEYDGRDHHQQHGYRREAWSGNDGGGAGNFRRGHHPDTDPRRYPQKNMQPQGGRHNVNNRAQGDISIEDWEFNEHGGVRGGDRTEEIGQRWQGQQQRGLHDGARRPEYPPQLPVPGMAQMDNVVTDGFVSRRPLQNNPDIDHASEPGNNTYLMQRLNHLPPGARPYNKFYPPPQSAAHSLPPTEAQIRAQTRPTRFYR